MNHEKYRNIFIGALLHFGMRSGSADGFLMINWKKAEGIMALLKDILAPIIYGACLLI